MELLPWYNSLTSKQQSIFKILLLILVVGLISSGLTYHYTKQHWSNKYDALQAQYDTYAANHPDSADDGPTAEDKIIAKALDQKKENVPVKETIGTTEKTVIYYTQKESKDDSDVQVTNKPQSISVSYNGKKQEIPTTNTEGQSIENGKLVVDQKQSATIDIDSIVNREIANKILEDEHKQAVLKRQKTQQTIWGTVIGVGIGYLAGHH